METIPLQGCAPTPLSAYLKALGVLRILSEQSGENFPRCRWENGAFILQTNCHRDELLSFFLNQYRPTPLVSPWNGGSGFYLQEGKTKEKGADGKRLKTGIRDQATEATRSVTAVELSKGVRIAEYREIIALTKKLLASLGRDSAPKDNEKARLIREIRNSFPDQLIPWLDAAFVFSGEDIVPPPLLLSGGNEGNLDFSNTFIQNILKVIDVDTDLPTEQSEAWLRNAFFGGPERLAVDSTSGYFAPSIRGGANSSTGFISKSHTNPWDFILTMEGVVLFTGNATKKLVSNKHETSFPFCVRASSGGYPSGETKEALQGKGEIWLPTWSTFTTYRELQCLLSEGRANLGKRSVRTGVDFAQAVSSLGVDRGLDSFLRYGILPRFGDSYFASRLQEIPVRRDTVIMDLLAPSEEWVSRFLQEAKADSAPGTIRRAATRLEEAIFARAAAAQAENPDTAQELLLALGDCERSLAGSSVRWLEDSYLSPLPPLPRGWVTAIDNGTREYRLACALASISTWFDRDFFPIRKHLEPVKVILGKKVWSGWDDNAKNEVVWRDGSIISVLCAIVKRRLLLAKASGMESWPEFAKVTAWPSDIAAFVEGRIDEDRFSELLWGLSLVDFSVEAVAANLPHPPADRRSGEVPPAFYAQLKLCFAGRLPEGKQIPIEPIIFNLAASGDGARASRQALRRLHGSNVPITHIEIPLSGQATRRCAAALLFPLWDSQFAQVCSSIAPDFFPQLTSNK